MLTVHNGTITNHKPDAVLVQSIADNPCMMIRVTVMQREISVNLDLRRMTPDGLKVLITRAAAELDRRST